jgi:hypothetical protein
MKTDELLELLAQVDPVDREAIRNRPTPEDELEAIVSAGRGASRSRRRRRERPRPVRLALAGAAGAALLGVIVSALPGRDGDASPEAANALQSVATLAAADAAPVAPSDIIYYRWEHADTGGSEGAGGPYGWLQPATIEQWVAPDGSGRVRTVTRGPEFGGPRDERRWRQSGAPDLGGAGVSDRTFGADGLTGVPYEGALPPVRDLPEDPGQLLELFESKAGDFEPANVKVFEYATSVLLHAGASPALRAALYEAVAEIEGVSLTGEVRDPLGRRGVGVSIESDYSGSPTRYTLIFDPETSQPLANTEDLLEPVEWIDGRRVGYTVLQDTGQVPDEDSRP